MKSWSISDGFEMGMGDEKIFLSLEMHAKMDMKKGQLWKQSIILAVGYI